MRDEARRCDARRKKRSESKSKEEKISFETNGASGRA